MYEQSYAGLSLPAADLYRGLGLFPELTLAPGVVTALLGAGPDSSATADGSAEPGFAACEPLLDVPPDGPLDGPLGELLGVGLVEETDGGRFRLPGPVRTHAAGKAHQLAPAERTAAVRRVAAWYLAAAVSADRCVLPARERIGPAAEAARSEPAAYPTAAPALDWLETELPNLLVVLRAAHDQELHEMAWQMCEALWGLFVSRRPHAEWITADEIGLASARACGDERAQARLLTQLGRALIDLRRLDEAEAHLAEALHLAHAAGDQPGQASALIRIGLIRLADERPDEAVTYFTQARDLHTEAGSARGAATATLRLGEAHRNAGRYHEATRCFWDAVKRFSDLDDQYNRLACSLALAETHLRDGDPRLAVSQWPQVLEWAQAEGARHLEARAHLLRADAHEAVGDPATTRHALTEALPLLERIDPGQASQARARLRRLTGTNGGAQNRDR